MLRITKLAENPTTTTLKVEGRIVEEYVSVLEEEILRTVQKSQWVVLDFSEVKFVDDSGVRMLNKLTIENVKIINCSLLIRDLLKKWCEP